MGVDTLLVAVGEEDRGRTEAIADAVIDIAVPTAATVVLVHVLTDETYRRAVEQTATAADRGDAGAELPAWLRRWAQTEATARPGIEGDVPAWVNRWSRGSTARRELAELDAAGTVLERTDLIRELVAAFEDAGVDHAFRSAVGDPADRVVALADELEADFVVVGGRNRSPAQQALFGSVSQEILRSVRCPVISVREAGQPSPP